MGERDMTVITSIEAQQDLQKWLKRAANGEDIIIKVLGLPPIRLVPNQQQKKRTLGSLKDKIILSTDFNGALPDDIAESFYPSSEDK